MKPLFVPLMGWAYDLFASGKKTTEYRLLGPRWNMRVCAPGRPVVLSRGYGKAHRESGVIMSFAALLAPPDPAAWVRAYGSLPGEGRMIAAIEIRLDRFKREPIVLTPSVLNSTSNPSGTTVSFLSADEVPLDADTVAALGNPRPPGRFSRAFLSGALPELAPMFPWPLPPEE